MAEVTPLDALEALHRELVAVCEHRFESLHILELQLDAHAQAFKKLLDKKPRSNASRDVVKTGPLASFGLVGRGLLMYDVCNRQDHGRR